VSTRKRARAKTRDEALFVRVQGDELRAFHAAADRMGLTLSAWVRLVCRRAAGMLEGEKR
jgi:antitoxin component of RelBE/YafQ-DinJ toxin-antitoxin module